MNYEEARANWKKIIKKFNKICDNHNKIQSDVDWVLYCKKCWKIFINNESNEYK